MDNTKPLDTDNVSIGDNDIRATKLDIENALKVEHDFPVSAGLPLARHKFPYGNSSQRPTGYDGRLYFNTEQKIIEQYQSGWKQIASLIPVGSKMLFYQLSAPNGWTRKFDYDNRMLRLVKDTPGGDIGGTNWFLPDLTLSNYTLIAHTHGISDMVNSDNALPPLYPYPPYEGAESGGSWAPVFYVKHFHTLSNNSAYWAPSSFPDIASGSVHNHTLTNNGNWRPKMASVIVAEKW